MRKIDADALKNKIASIKVVSGDENKTAFAQGILGMVCHYIDQAETIDDSDIVNDINQVLFKYGMSICVNPIISEMQSDE